MANYNSVPLGRAGTGAAYVLGESQAANQLLGDLDYNQKVQQQNELLKRQHAQQLASDWTQNQLKIKGGSLWESELQKDAADVIDLGTRLRQMNVNPYRPNPNDPIQVQASEMFLNKKRLVEAKADFRDQQQKILMDEMSLPSKQAEGYYDPESIAEINSYPSKVTLNEAFSNGYMTPRLRRSFQEGEFLGKIKPTPRETKTVVNGIETKELQADMPRTRQVVISNYINDPQAKAYLERNIGVPIEKIPGIDPLLPDTSDFKTLEEANDQIYRSSPFIPQLAQMGIKYDTQEYDDFLNKISRQQSQAYKQFNNYIDDRTKEVAAKQGIKFDQGYNFELEKMNMQRTRFNERNDRQSKANESSNNPISITIHYGEKGQDNVHFDEYVPITKSKMNFAGSVPTDLKTGKEGSTLAPSNDYEIVGVGNAPYIKKDASSVKPEFRGSLSQPNYASEHPDVIERKPIIHVKIPAKGEYGKAKDYFIPYDRLPENVKNSKSVREALAKFKPATQQQSNPQNTTQKQSSNSYIPPKKGEIRGGYKYIGGDASKPSSWQEVRK